MKRLICAIVAAVVCVMQAVSASAAVIQYDYSGLKFSFGSNYKVSTEEEVANSPVDGLVFLAVTEDSAHQIQCLKTETAFSKEMGSFSSLSPADLTPAGQKLFSEGFETAEFGDEIYLKQTLKKDELYTVVYATVSGGKLYTFTYFGSDPSKIGEFMGTVALPDSDSRSGPNVLMIVILSICIAGFVAFIVVLILSFVKDYRHRKMEQNENIVSNYIKIKRRKY